MIRPPRFCLSLLTCAGLGAQQVLVVDAAGGSAFTQVQPAIDAAQPGDTVLVRNGTYDPVTIDKSLSLIADGQAVIVPTVIITSTPPGSVVLVRGVRNETPSFPISLARLEVSGCAGEVWIQELRFELASVSLAFAPTLTVTDSSSVVLSDVDVVAPNLEGAHGMRVVRSTCHIFDSRITGGGSVASAPAAGIDVVDATVHLHGSQITGGRGLLPSRGCPFDGGPGLRAVGNSTITVVDSTLTGGAPGQFIPIFCPATTAVMGPATDIQAPASITTIPAAPLRWNAPSVARETQPIDYAITGLPGDVVALAFALQPAAFYLPLIQSSLLVGTSFVGIPVGTVPATGALTVPTVVPELGPGVDVQRYYVQLIALRTTGTLQGGSGRALTLLDSSF